MRPVRSTIIATTVAAAIAASYIAAQASVSSNAVDATNGVYAPGQVLVQYRAGVAAANQTALEHANGANRIASVADLNVDVLNVPAGAEQHVITALQQSGKVQFAELNAVATATDVTPNDYWWPNEWGPVKVHAPAAWSTTTGSSSTVVAVLDTGLTQSSDLTGNVVAGYNFVAGSTNTTDDNGHGTMASAVVGAKSNNSIGVASYCWQCSVMPVKVMDSSGQGTYANIASGITWATDHGAKVISMSLSGTTDSSTLHSAVQYAHNHGVVLAAAAGNSGCNCPAYPAAYSEVLGVAATDGSDAMASYSDYGSWVKVAAPGTNWVVTMSGGYGQFAGTSSATPVVAAVAGLLLSASPSATNTQIESALETSAANVGTFVKYGRIDAAAGLAALGSAPAPSPSPSPSPTPSPTTTTTTYSGSLSGKATSKTFQQTLGTGSAQASLSFSKSGSLTVSLLAPNGSTVATASGASPVRVTANVSSGTYSWVVSGSTRTSFTLTVTATS